MRISSGEIVSWSTRQTLSPPPTGWHWDSDHGPRWPAVTGFGDAVSITASLWYGARDASCPSVSLLVRCRLLDTVLGWASLNLPSYQPSGETVLHLTSADRMPVAYIARLDDTYLIVFEYSLDGGKSWLWFGGARPSAWYFMHPAFRQFAGTRYDLALDKVVQYAAGSSDQASIVAALNIGIDQDIFYDPDFVVEPPILNVYFYHQAFCRNNADLLRYLSSTAGCPGAVVQCTWGGSSPTRVDFMLDGRSFQLQRGAHDGAESNPRFRFHAITCWQSMVCDPSYGQLGYPLVTQVCRPYSMGDVGGNPSFYCYSPEPQFVPRQQWGSGFPPAEVQDTPCTGTSPP